MTTTLLESAVPARLGRSFRWLVASRWTTNLGDGIALAAGPLLIASQTRDPFLVALGAMLQWLPALLFGLHAGAIADRVDRRLLVALADGSRIVVVGVLVLSVVTDRVSIAVVLGAMFLLGTGETFADTSAATFAADARAPRRPRRSATPGSSALVVAEPARRAADRRGAVRGRRGLAVRQPGGARRARRGAGAASAAAARP